MQFNISSPGGTQGWISEIMRGEVKGRKQSVENHKFFDTSLNDFAGIDDALLVVPGLVAVLKDYALILQL